MNPYLVIQIPPMRCYARKQMSYYYRTKYKGLQIRTWVNKKALREHSLLIIEEIGSEKLNDLPKVSCPMNF